MRADQRSSIRCLDRRRAPGGVRTERGDGRPSLTEISTPGPTQKTVTAGDGWQQVTGSPLSARSSSSVTWVADRFVVVGGDDGPPCPPTADCACRRGRRCATVRRSTRRRATGRGSSTRRPRSCRRSRRCSGARSTCSWTSRAPGRDRRSSRTTPPPTAGPRCRCRRTAPDDWSRSGTCCSACRAPTRVGAVDSWFDPVTNAWHRIPDDPLGPATTGPSSSSTVACS